MNNAQAAAAAISTPRCVPITDPHAAFVATTGLQFSDPACIHFNRQSLITLGQRHAQAFATIDRNH